MVTWILDSSAILRYTDNEAGAGRIQEILQQFIEGQALVSVSALHWGEVAGKLYRMRGLAVMKTTLQRLTEMGVAILPASAEQAVRAALIRADHKIPYVDAFGVALASAANHVFVTADFDFKPAAKLAKIEFLPAK